MCNKDLLQWAELVMLHLGVEHLIKRDKRLGRDQNKASVDRKQK
jgi:hypothetical protein